MLGKEKLFLKMRNNRGEGQKNETYCKHYKKCFGAYLFHALFSFQSLSVIIVGLGFSIFAFILNYDDDEKLFKYIAIGTVAFICLFWVYQLVFKLWYWKFTKHVFVTNEGIWISSCSTFWWSAAPDFMGKVKFWAPSWSLYSWSELKKVSCDKKDSQRGPVKLANAFENIDLFLKGLTRKQTIYLTRWDGVEEIDFLSKVDAQNILNYANTHKKARKRSKKDKADKLITD